MILQNLSQLYPWFLEESFDQVRFKMLDYHRMESEISEFQEPIL